jgi:hypothetical protein
MAALSKKELQDALIEKGELAEKIKGMGVAELRALYDEISEAPVLEFEEEEVYVAPNRPIDVPDKTEPEWQSFIMKQFADGELYKDKNNGTMRPTVHGLRRLVEKFIGPILESEAIPYTLPSHENKYFATFGWQITVYDRKLDRTKVCKDVADHHHLISDGIFRLYPSTNAATKAEGRALRKLLNINVACSEEVANIDEEKVEEIFSKNDGTIVPSQIAAIKQLCKRLNTTPDEYLDGMELTELDYIDAQNAIKHLNKEVSKKGNK